LGRTLAGENIIQAAHTPKPLQLRRNFARLTLKRAALELRLFRHHLGMPYA
jgi:hypothetical protein